MSGNKITAFPPLRDPREQSVTVHAATADIPDPPRELFPRDPEAPSPSGLRLHLAEEAGYDATTEEQIRTLDASEALHRLVEDIGFREVVRILKVIAIAHGETL